MENNFNAKSRVMTSRFNTGVENVFLEIKTMHYNGFYIFSISRLQIKDGICSMKIDRRTLLEDPAPITRKSFESGRYSAKKMQELHFSLLANLSNNQIDNAVAWAERY